MTKTLTEQWKNGGLECGYYYIKVNPKCGKDTVVAYYVNFEGYFYTRLGAWRNDVIKEVIAPVPAYDVWKNIHEQWKVAIPQIERLQEQLNEANEIIKKYRNYHYEELPNNKVKYFEKNTATKYLEKWGLK